MGGKNSFYHRTILGGPAPSGGGSPAPSKPIMSSTGGTDPNTPTTGGAGLVSQPNSSGAAQPTQIAGDTPEQQQQKALVTQQEQDKAAVEAYNLAHPPAPVFVVPKNVADAEKQMINRQAAIAAGAPGTSISQQSLKQAQDQASQQAMALAASQRGSSNPALAFRQAQIGNQQMGLENAQAGAIMMEQERRAADQAIATTAAAHKGVAIQQAQLNQQGKIADKQVAVAERGQNIQLASSVGQTAMYASDKNAKKDISPTDGSAEDIEAFMNALKGYDYKYKDSKNGTGEKTGIMAQDLEKSKVGKTMVDEVNGTKMVDTNKAIGAILAGMADLNKKIKKMEK